MQHPAGERQRHLDKVGEHHPQPEPDGKVQDHPDNGRGNPGQCGGQQPVATKRLDIGRTKENPQETRREGHPGGDQRPQRAGQHRIQRARGAIGTDETDKLGDHDQRSGGGFGHAKTIQHLASVKPAIMADCLLRHVGQHGIGTAKGDHRHLAEKHSLLDIDMTGTKPAIEDHNRSKPQDSAYKGGAKGTAVRRYGAMIRDTAVDDALIACLAGAVIRTVILGAHGHPPQQRGQRRTQDDQRERHTKHKTGKKRGCRDRD